MVRLRRLTRRGLRRHAGAGRHRGLAGLLAVLADGLLTHRLLTHRWLSGHRLSSHGLTRRRLTGSVRAGAVEPRAVLALRTGSLLALSRLALSRLALSRLARGSLARVLAVRRELSGHGLSGHGLAGHGLAARHRLTRLPAVAGSALLRRVGLAGDALLARVLRSLLPARSGTLLPGALLARSWLVRTLMRSMLGRALRRHAGLAGTVLAGLRLSGACRRVLAGLLRAVRAGLGRNAVLTAGGRSAVLLAGWRRLDPVGVVGVLRGDRATLLLAARAGLRRVRSGRPLGVRGLRTGGRVSALGATLLAGLLALALLLSVLRVRATGGRFSFVLLGGWTLSWHS